MDELTLIIIRARVMTGFDCWDLAERAQLVRKLWESFQNSGIRGKYLDDPFIWDHWSEDRWPSECKQ